MQTIKCDVSIFSLLPACSFYNYADEDSEADETFRICTDTATQHLEV